MRTYKYIVNEKKRTVVCLIYVKDEPFVTEYSEGFIVFKGIAKCGANDEFKEDFGKELAKKRALRELTDFELRIIGIEYSDECIDEIRKCYIRMLNAIDRKKFLEYQHNALRKEIKEMVCPF